ncbi:repetitive organellar protein-like [Homalodisca vitripennis]|uniref:repetitive organellar protein-like n=1 Tax=Homalodisca vitripennis TaxID=197043 RepID=UPI001EEC170A|nr:repetitive organellar protein-like [Homalodisca vitripennis]XP_046663946.1 repetitive organellar protein-like [Homalodisca vitripennis]
MDNNSESQKNLSEINFSTATDVSDSKSDPPPGSSPKKPIQLGVVQSSLGNRTSTSSFNKKSRWDQAPESGEETETKESKTELQDVEQSTSVKHLIQKFENITGDSQLVEKQCEELPIKPVAAHTSTPSRVKLVRTNFMKIDKPTPNLGKTGADDLAASSSQGKDNILKQLTPQTSTTEATEIKDIKSVTPSTALEIISSCYDSPSDESSQDTDISSTSGNKTKDSVSLEKLNDPLKDDTNIESKSDIHTEKNLTSEINVDTDIQLDEDSSSRSRISSKEDTVDFEVVTVGDVSSYTQSLSGKNTPIEDSTKEKTHPCNIRNTKNDINSKINLSSVGELLPQPSTFVIHEIKSDPLTKSDGNVTVSSKVLDHTQTSELKNPAINKEGKYRELNEDSPNNVIGNDDSDLSEFSKDVQEETVNPPNVSKLVDTKTAQKSICSIDLSEKSETDEDNSKLLTQITPATENISSQDQLETGESKTDIKTSLVEENVLLHEEIIESKTEGNIDGGQNNILKTDDSSLKTSEGNNASVSSFGSFSESSSKIYGTDVNSKDQKPSSSSITSNESEKKEYFELPVNVGKTPVIEEVCVKKHMYITGDNINISEDINLNENKDILTDTIESNTTENISLYNDGVDATMEKMFSDNLESGDEILAPVEESNKEDTILSKSIKSPKASVLSEDILSTNENKETSCFERNKNKIIETSDSLLEMLESESSPSCNDTKKDIHQHHTKLHIPITGTNTLNEPDILTKTLNSYKEESCVSSEENISIDNKNNLEVETTSEHQQITRINVEDSLKSVNIETIDIEKCSQDKSKMSPPNIPKFDATVESLVHKDTVLLSPERNNDSLNAEVTKEPANKRPVSFEQSENIEESIMLKHSESAEDLQKTGLQVETKKDSPSIKSNILNIGEMDTNDSLINSKDNQLNTVVISTEIDTQLNITPSKIEAESKVRKPDSILEKLAEEKHSLINIERNEELEQIIEDTEIYETSASTHLSSLVEEDDTQKSNCVKGDGKSFEVSTKVNETIKEHFSDNTVVYSKDYDLPLNEDHSESMSHKETQKENTDVLATDQNKIEEIVSQSFVERQTKEAMAPTEQDPTVVAVQSELSPFQINLKSNNEENKHFLTVETSELINNAIIDSKTLSSVETLEVNNDISLDGNRENITIDITEDNLIQIEECETLESGKLEKHTSPNDGTCSSQQHLLNIDSSIEDKLLSPEKNCTSKINPVVNPSNNEQISMLDLRETGNLSIHEDIETENLQVNTLESEIKNIQNTTSLNTELDDSCNIMLQNTTVDIEEKQQHMEIETSMGEQPINCSEIILKAENKDCKGIVQEVKLVTQPKPDVPVVVSSKEESRKIALESEHSLENKSMYDFDKPTCSGEGDSEAFITEEAEVKQEDIAINESDRMEECLQLKSADKDKMPDSKDEGNMSLGHSNQEEIDEIMITEVKSKVDAESLAVVGVEDVPCEQSVTSPKENSSFDHKTLIDTKTDVIDSNKEKYIGESSQLSSHIQMENCQVIDIKHSDELHLDRKLSQVAQPDTKVDLSELDNLPDKNSTKCLDEEENLDKLIPDVSNDTTEITCDDSEAETIQAIDLFLQDTDSENKEETEPKTNKNDDKTEMEVFDSRDNTTQKIEDVDIDPSLELRENPLVDRDSEINEGYMETSQEKEISKDRTVQKQSENLRDNFSDEEIFDQSPNMSFDQEISQTGSSHKEENECKAEEHLIYNPENVSDKENLLKEVPEIVESNTKSNLLPQSPNILEPDSISLDIKDSSSKENEGELDEPVKNRESSTREPEIVTKSCSGQDKLVSSSPLDFQVKHLSAELEVESTAKSTDIERNTRG